MASQILDVSIANAYLKQLIESDETLSDCWIRGEVSERFEARSGHIYFTLVDGQSTLKSVIFRGNAQRQRAPFRDGDKVVAHGRLSIYEQRSQYQLIADSVQPAGLGLQALQLELLRQKLESEGLFDPSRKRPLPAMPAVVGVVTSADGAVRHDIQHVLTRRYPLGHLVISPAQVQGDGAPASLVHALERLIRSGLPDVIIIGRGGGSAEDLMAFNDEQLVRAIFASPVPVVSAVGHETDWSLTDLVADVRAPTPSAAAQIVAPSVAELAEYASSLTREVQRRGHWRLDADRSGLSQIRSSLRPRAMIDVLNRQRPAIDLATIKIVAAGHTRLERASARLDALASRERHLWMLSAVNRRASADRLASELRSLNPDSVMQRGFALVTRTDSGTVVRSSRELSAGDSATIALRDGEIATRVEAVRPTN